MADNKKPTHDELIKLLPTSGWRHNSGAEKNHTLEELVRASHARHQRGEVPGAISHFETALELDMVQLQQLWMHLGLPT